MLICASFFTLRLPSLRLCAYFREDVQLRKFLPRLLRGFACVLLLQCPSALFARAQTSHQPSHETSQQSPAAATNTGTGTVRDAITGKPVAGARVRVEQARVERGDSHASASSKTLAGTISRSDGSFALVISAAEPPTNGSMTSVVVITSALGYATDTSIVKVVSVAKGVNAPPSASPATSFSASTYTFAHTVVIALKQAAVRSAGVTIERSRVSDAPTRNTTVLSDAVLKRSLGQTLGETLKNTAGVTLLQTGASVAKPVIRGLHSQRVVVVNAGVAQEGQQWGAEHAPEIDPFAAARIEVLRGAAGVEHGAGAIGGVVRVVPRALCTERRFDAGLAAEISAAAFSNNAQGAASALAEGGLAGTALDGLAWRVQGSARRAGDYRAALYNVSNTGFGEANASVHIGWQRAFPSPTSPVTTGAEAYYSLFTTELGIFRGSHIGSTNDLLRAIAADRPLVEAPFSYAIRAPKQQISHDLWALRAFCDASDIGRFEAQYSWQFNRRGEFDAHNARVLDSARLLTVLNSRPSLQLELITQAANVKFRHKTLSIPLAETLVGILSGTAGVEVSSQTNIRTGRVYLIPDFSSLAASAFAMENFAWSVPQNADNSLLAGDWLVNAGARFDIRRTHVQALQTSFQAVPDTTQLFSGVNAALGLLWRSPENISEKSHETTAQKPDGNWSLAVNVATAWRPPQVNELFSNDVHHGTAQFEIGNAALRPERSLQADFTATYANADLFGGIHSNNVTNTNSAPQRLNVALEAELSVFWNAMEGFIYLLPDLANPVLTVRGAFPAFRYTQSDAVLRGLEARWELAFSTDNEVSNGALLLGGTFSLVRGDRTGIDAGRSLLLEPLFQMPADRLRLYAAWLPERMGIRFADLSITDLRFEVACMLVRSQDRFPANVDYKLPPSAYALWEASISGSTNAIRWNLTVQNLANTAFRDYLSRLRYFADDAGLNLVARVSVPLAQ
jgi:iron complex outermembrane recepter protein